MRSVSVLAGLPSCRVLVCDAMPCRASCLPGCWVAVAPCARRGREWSAHCTNHGTAATLVGACHRLTVFPEPEVSAHLLAVTPTAHWLEYVDWAAPILAQPLVIADGAVKIGDGPGNGIQWDSGAVARYRMK